MGETWHCKEIADNIKRQIINSGVKKSLLIITVGDDPASKVYVKGKLKDCEEVGFLHRHVKLNNNSTTKDIINAINDSTEDGIIVQLPLPEHIDKQAVISSIPTEKDVDGFSISNVGSMVLGKQCLLPCTPAGVVEILDYHNVDIEGKDICVIGRSNIVGKPLTNMLINRGATVTICNSKTKNLEQKTKLADIIISAVGKANLVTPDMIKPDSILIDVGINRDSEGKICGDISPDCDKIAYARTPVPGGVGLMTRAMLLNNLRYC